jgi:predicted porin
MKKSLLALAAMGAFASAAQAQSSVTVYGVIDEVVFTNVNIFCRLSVSCDEPVGAILNE